MPVIDPVAWLEVANVARPKVQGVTDWFPGTLAPAHIGWYERHFTDSPFLPADVSLQYWDGACWLNREGRPHWRQVGHYPAWRGMEFQYRIGDEVRLVRGSRSRKEGPGCERLVRARLNGIDAMQNVKAVLLQDDPLDVAPPRKIGEAGIWHGLSFLGR